MAIIILSYYFDVVNPSTALWVVKRKV